MFQTVTQLVRTKNVLSKPSSRLLVGGGLVLLYAACWWPTRGVGVRDVVKRVMPTHWVQNEAAVAPLIIRLDVTKADEDPWAGIDLVMPETTRCYYFWCFGYVAKLPYER